MDLVKILLLCIAASLIAVMLRKQHPEMAAMVAISAGLIAIMGSMTDLTEIVAAFSNLSQRAGLDAGAAATMLRACGIAILCEFGSTLCTDAGEGVLASRIDFAGRIALVAMSIPLLTKLMDVMYSWLP